MLIALTSVLVLLAVSKNTCFFEKAPEGAFFVGKVFLFYILSNNSKVEFLFFRLSLFNFKWYFLLLYSELALA